MKKCPAFVFFLLFAFPLLASPPLAFNYQAVVRDANGEVISLEQVELKVEILKGQTGGSVVFSEVHNTTTNSYGLINIQVGSINSLEGLQWHEGNYFIRTSIDNAILGTAQLLSVPYALHTLSSSSSFSGNYNDLINAPDITDYVQVQDPGPGDMIFYQDDNWVTTGTGEEGQILRVVNNMPQWTDIAYDGTITDIDGNVYSTVFIGNQHWMAENLRTTRFADGGDIQGVFLYSHNGISGIDTDEQMAVAYGRLYDFSAVNDQRGLCPAGWRVPSDQDWTELTNFLADQEIGEFEIGNALKSCSQVNSPIGGDCDTSEHPRWNSHSQQYGKDNFGFSGLPAGYYMFGSYNLLGANGYWWTSTVATSTTAWGRAMLFNYGQLFRYNDYQLHMGMSVRCIKN